MHVCLWCACIRCIRENIVYKYCPICLDQGRRSECWEDWTDACGSWNGGFNYLWFVAGSHQNLQVSRSTHESKFVPLIGHEIKSWAQ